MNDDDSHYTESYIDLLVADAKAAGRDEAFAACKACFRELAEKAAFDGDFGRGMRHGYETAADWCAASMRRQAAR